LISKSNRPIDLDWGAVVCCQLVESIVANENFSHAVFFHNQTNKSRQIPDNDFGGLVEMKGNAIESKLHAGHNLVSLALPTLLRKIVALQLVTL
jgi:hypothetical protein